jgi:hypothetical protein
MVGWLMAMRRPPKRSISGRAAAAYALNRAGSVTMAWTTK